MASIFTAPQLGSAVRQARREQQITQAELAAQAKVSRAWLAKFEGGHPSASIEQVMRVLSALQLEIALVPRQLSSIDQQIADALAQRKARRA